MGRPRRLPPRPGEGRGVRRAAAGLLRLGRRGCRCCRRCPSSARPPLSGRTQLGRIVPRPPGGLEGKLPPLPAPGRSWRRRQAGTAPSAARRAQGRARPPPRRSPHGAGAARGACARSAPAALARGRRGWQWRWGQEGSREGSREGSPGRVGATQAWGPVPEPAELFPLAAPVCMRSRGRRPGLPTRAVSALSGQRCPGAGRVTIEGVEWEGCAAPFGAAALAVAAGAPSEPARPVPARCTGAGAGAAPSERGESAGTGCPGTSGCSLETQHPPGRVPV
ncbi:collagen alpha-1(I) chain [Melospiza georgiana]|uniref:collagen alpha-1(I) chain n=1 Tax=Melospiza georgiana TaxID=44398 RepID=UPI0025AD2CCA|nr:collagen alpha-1(I) chain [Melospiza georgiana]